MAEGAIRSISINKGIKSEDIIKLWDKQHIPSQIARTLNCSITNICNRLIALGIYDRKEAKRRRKILMSKRFSGEGNPMYGKPGTQLGKKFTEEHKEKTRRALKGKHTSPRTEFKKGHSFSKEAIQKIREARLNQVVPTEDTSIEKMLQEGLHEKGIGFEVHVPFYSVRCQPDIFIKPNICVFADGDYWHANPDTYEYSKLNEAQQQNIERDRRQNEVLKSQGYRVLRFWEHEIQEDLEACIAKIEDELN